MIRIRRADDRGTTRLGWLDSRHSFSVGSYFDPEHHGFRSLRVINDDRVAPAGGFPTHPHRDMEIVTVVLEGALEHRDALGNSSILRPGEVQRISAGTGITHSEFNPSADEPAHFLQIWILPERQGLEPGYEQRAFPADECLGRLRPVATRDGRDGSLTIHQDAEIHRARLRGGEQVAHSLRPGRHAWLQIASGAVRVGEHRLATGDGLAVSDETRLVVRAEEETDLLLFELA